MKYYEATDFPTIYETVYWGNFKITENRDITEIVKNRNKFITDFNIKTTKFKNVILMRYIHHIINHNKDRRYDHLEEYKTHDDKYVLVNSPYDKTDKMKEILTNDGWIEIYNLYSQEAMTFIKILSKDELRSLYKAREN